MTLRRAALLFALTSIVACTAQPTETIDVGPTATASRDGFVLELWVAPRDVRVGDRVVARVRVMNTGNAAPMWETNTCGVGPAPIEVTAANDVEPGLAWDGSAAKFKQAAMRAVGIRVGGPSVVGHFWDAAKGANFSCPAISIQRPFEPGQREEATLAWDVEPSAEVPIQAGEATLTSTFTSAAGELTASATINILDDGQRGAPIAELIDVALGEPAFRAWLEGHPADASLDPHILFWPNERGVYPEIPPYSGVSSPCVEIGAFFTDDPEHGFMGAVVLDLATLRVIGTRFE